MLSTGCLHINASENLTKALVPVQHYSYRIFGLTPKMLILKPFQSFFTCFYLFGLSPFILFKQPNKKPPIAIVYLPRLLLTVFMTILISHDLLYHKFSANNTMLNLSIWMAIFDVVFIPNSFRATWQTMCTTIDHFEDTLQIQYPLKMISKQFYWKFLLQILIVSAGLYVQYSICSHEHLSLSEINLAIVFLYKCVHLSHITIYIDFMKIALTCLCEKIMLEYRKQCNGDRSDCSKNIILLRQIEATYFKIWRISDGVNRQFGWFLATFPIDIVIIVTHAFYWMTVDLLTSDDDNTYTFLCKIFD